MLKHAILMFIGGWVFWFVTDKHPASLGTLVPPQSGDLLANFQLAFDLMKAGYLKAAYVFLWKAHYVVLSLVAGLLSSMIFEAGSKVLRQRRLREVMRTESIAPDRTESDE